MVRRGRGSDSYSCQPIKSERRYNLCTCQPEADSMFTSRQQTAERFAWNSVTFVKMEKNGLEIVSVEEVNETSPAYEKCPWISQVGFHSFLSFFFIFRNQTANAARACSWLVECARQRLRVSSSQQEGSAYSLPMVSTCPNEAGKFSSGLFVNFWRFWQ